MAVGLSFWNESRSRFFSSTRRSVCSVVEQGKWKVVDNMETEQKEGSHAGEKLALKEIRTALGDKYSPIITIEEASDLSRLTVKTLYKKISEGLFKKSVKRGRPVLFWTDRFVKELMGGQS